MAIASKSLIMSKHFMQRYLRFLIDLFENKRTAGQKVSTGMHTKSHLDSNCSFGWIYKVETFYLNTTFRFSNVLSLFFRQLEGKFSYTWTINEENRTLISFLDRKDLV